jgi:hypothetical protein
MELTPFEFVTKHKLTFSTTKGTLMLEELWDLPLTSDTGRSNLNDVAKQINRGLSNDEESFVPSETAVVDVEGRMKLEAVKRIIAVKVDERKQASEARAKASQKQEILAALADAERGVLKSKTPEELRALLAAL